MPTAGFDLDQLTLRRAIPGDAATLIDIAAATFVETFAHLYPPADLQAYLATAYTVERYREKLEEPHTGVWFAHVANELAGFIVAGPCKLPIANLEPNAGEVQQLYIYAQHQNLRIGTRLMDTALAWLATENRAPLYVGVWSENQGAQRLYRRYGFSQVGEYDFPVGNTLDHELILRRGGARAALP